MITLGGIPLLIPDNDGELAEFLRKHNPLGDASLFAGPMDGCPRRRRYEQDKGVGLPQYNWPEPPPLCINSLYWPTGATRYARGLFLATGRNKDLILGIAGSSNNSPLPLKIGDDEAGKTIETDVYVLGPRPISGIDTGEMIGEETLWLIPVVDERYWWATSLPVDEPGVDETTTWSELLAEIAGSLGVTADEAEISADYLQPDKTEFNRKFASGGEMLEAAAASVGHRVVRDIDGTVRTVTASTDDIELPAGALVVAGDDDSDVGGELPAEVLTVFRKVAYYGQLADEQAYTKQHGTESGLVVVSGKTQTIYSAACADFSSGGLTPANDTALDTLAAKIAADYYAWRSKRFAYTLAGIVDWTLTGHEDAIVWDFGRQTESGELLTQTRVWSLPPDCCPDTHGAGDPDVFIIEPRQWGVLQAALDQGSSATVWIVIHDGTDWVYTDPAIEVLAYDFMMNSGESMADDTKVRVEWDGVVWSVVNGLCVTSDTLPTEPA